MKYKMSLNPIVLLSCIFWLFYGIYQMVFVDISYTFFFCLGLGTLHGMFFQYLYDKNKK